uniref:Carboxylic ester hydrolase n=1 Tax=Locusta migratoria TaxID=7004 RepID=W8EH07_LOCMI|nr:carboxylesterase [Locusta migratoria]
MSSTGTVHLVATLYFCLVSAAVLAQEYVTVETAVGSLRGSVRATYTNKPMYSFEGIPYAEPPVDDLRFQPPVSKEPWSGVRDALQPGSSCPQYVNNVVSGDEDCLFLNVYSPSLPGPNDGPDSLKAVMVWIHGGCFREGRSDTATPHYFVDNDVVFVSINYRLGLLGFLSTGDDVVPGNLGLKDQTAALRWVQRNIPAFGGHPRKVTIFGESAGGASIHYHILSPLSNYLYKNAIAMSGTALSPWAFSRNATDRAIRFAEYLGHTAKDSNDLVEFFKTVDAKTLVTNIDNALSDEDRLSLFTCVWAPSVEPKHESAFLTEEPWKLVARGPYSLVPFLAGSTDLEQLAQTQPGGVLSTEEQVSNLKENFDEIVACDVRLPTREEQLDAARRVRQFYFNESDVSPQNNYTTALFDSHLFFVEGVDAVVRSTARYSTHPVYYYQFAYNGPISQFPGAPGAAHADDVTYLFLSSSLEPDADGAVLRDQMTAMFANFAKTGDPTPEVNSLLTEKWLPYNETSPFYLRLSAPLSTGMDMFEPYMSFWHDLLP